MGDLNFISLAPIGILILLAVLHGLDMPIVWEPWWWLPASVHLIAATILAYLVYFTAGGPPGFALMHPFGAAMLVSICMRAAWHLRRGRPIEWRGTSYQ